MLEKSASSAWSQRENAIEEILNQDPRPAYQDDPERVYHLDYAGWAVDFIVIATTVCVKNIIRKDVI